MDYRDTYTSEIFKKSNCLLQEKTLYTKICGLLEDQGYENVHPHVYSRGCQRVILAIVDDPEHANYAGSEDFYSDLSANDILITDAQLLRPILAQVIQLPREWFGIYAYDPSIYRSMPDRLFSLPVNRIDFNRSLLLLRMNMLGRLDQGYVNFNCADHSQQNDIDRKNLWRTYCDQVNVWHHNKYQRSAQELESQIPFRNHDLDHDTVCQAGAVNIVIETYSSDFSISISEKIFRALVTPRPWTVLAAPWTVCWLQLLGFDVMQDIIDHRIYDGLRMCDDKIAVFERFNHDIMLKFSTDTKLINQSWYQNNILPRAHRAASHNIKRLWDLHTLWQRSQTSWLSEILCPAIK